MQPQAKTAVADERVQQPKLRAPSLQGRGIVRGTQIAFMLDSPTRKQARPEFLYDYLPSRISAGQGLAGIEDAEYWARADTLEVIHANKVKDGLSCSVQCPKLGTYKVAARFVDGDDKTHLVVLGIFNI